MDTDSFAFSSNIETGCTVGYMNDEGKARKS